MRYIDILRYLDKNISRDMILELHRNLYSKDRYIANLKYKSLEYLYKFEIIRLDDKTFYQDDIIKNLQDEIIIIVDESLDYSIGYDGFSGFFLYSLDKGFKFIPKEIIYDDDICICLEYNRELFKEITFESN